MLKEAAVDIEECDSDSTRAAAVFSAGGAETVSLKTSVKAAGWTTDRTYSRLYKKKTWP